MNSLPVDVLAHLLSYTHQRGEYRWHLLHWRLTCRRFDAAIKQFQPLWLEILGRRGPRRIGPGSIHRPNWQRGLTCRFNAENKCMIAAHYAYDSLVPRYDLRKPLKAFAITMKTRRATKTNALRRRLESQRKALVKYDEHYSETRRERVALLQSLERKLERWEK